MSLKTAVTLTATWTLILLLNWQVKLGYLASQHAALTAKNIQASLNGQPLKIWKPNGGMEVLLCLYSSVTPIQGYVSMLSRNSGTESMVGHSSHRSRVSRSGHSLLCSVQAMIVTLGPKHGSGHIGPVTLTGCFSFMAAKVIARNVNLLHVVHAVSVFSAGACDMLVACACSRHKSHDAC